MKKKKLLKVSVVFITMIFIVQASLVAYSAVAENFSDGSSTTSEDSTESIDTTNVEISQEILDIIQEQDPQNYDKSVENYKNMLAKLEVQGLFKAEIERLIKEGHNLPDLLIAYEFLYENFGKLSELEEFSSKKEMGQTWAEIFTSYNKTNGEFIPRSFDPEYLQALMNEPYISSDDIMIADRISNKLKVEYHSIISRRLDGAEWREINEELGILNNKSHLPRVQVTRKEIDKYTMLTSLSEGEIVGSFVLANKLGKEPKYIIDKVKAGNTEEEIYSECYGELYY